VSCSLMCDV